MDTQTYEDVLKEAEKLPADQCLLLIERLIHHVRNAETAPTEAPAWEDYAGPAPHPLCGEDAQAWVNRSRRESDAARVSQ